ncbi:MAG: S9 family peptidase [bacterium]
MNNKILFSAIVLFLSILGCSSTGDKNLEAPLVPMRDFFRNPEKTGFKLSPNGQYLSFMQPWEKRLNIYIQKIGEKEATKITNAKERDIAGYFWKGDNKIVYVQDSKGDENFHLFSVNIDGTNLIDLTPFEKVKVEILDDLSENPNNLLIQMNKRNPNLFDVYRIDITNGKFDMIAENPGNITSWLTDHEGKLRIAVTTDGVNSSILYRENETDTFKIILTTTFKENFNPLFFTFDNKNIYASSNIMRDKSEIVEYNLAENKESKIVFKNEDFDAEDLLYSKKYKKLLGVNLETWKLETYYFDNERKMMQEYLEKKLGGYEVIISGSNKNEDKFIIRTYNDKTRGAYYFYNLKNHDLIKLVEITPWLNEQDMAEMKPIKYKTRDGLVIPGYLTLPKGKEAKNIPIVINPHGGPWARDIWQFNPEVQFLANRGYGVLQMNFRGSTGYGKKFWQASFKEWGRAMQNDISDGVKWLIKEGIANPKKIAIYGGSYGGYATLAGLTFTPELYAAGVDYVGVSNIFTFLQSIPPYWKPYLEMLYEMVGNPGSDSLNLWETSPVFHVANITAPLLVAQGAQDPRVNKSESDQMVEALQKKGIEVPYIVKENEGHGFRNEENKFEFYGTMETFLAKHLGGKVLNK